MSLDLELLAEAIASSVGGIVSVVATYPIELVKNRIASSSDASTAKVVRELWRSGGPLGFYHGVTVSSVGNAVEKFIYFFSFAALRKKFALAGFSPGMAQDLIAGCLSDLSHLPVSLPLDTLLIKVVNNDDPSRGALDVAKDVVREKGGVLGFYSGFASQIILSLKPAVQLVVFEGVKKRLLHRQGPLGSGSLPALHAFLLGALSRSIGTVLLFPYIRAKVLLQKGGYEAAAQGPGGALASLHRVILAVLQREGLLGWYQGLPQELTRSALSTAFMMMVRERLTASIKKMLLGKALT